jgi:hypothetical protein
MSTVLIANKVFHLILIFKRILKLCMYVCAWLNYGKRAAPHAGIAVPAVSIDLKFVRAGGAYIF